MRRRDSMRAPGVRRLRFAKRFRDKPHCPVCGLGGHVLTRPAITRAVIVFALALVSLAVSYTIVAVSPDPYDRGYERGR